MILGATLSGELSWWDLLWWNGSSSYPYQWWHGTGWAFVTMGGIIALFLAVWFVLRKLLPKLIAKRRLRRERAQMERLLKLAGR